MEIQYYLYMDRSYQPNITTTCTATGTDTYTGSDTWTHIRLHYG
jgi:hypothetical protein